MRNGRTIIEHREADIIRYIFDEYIKGASLKTLAECVKAHEGGRLTVIFGGGYEIEEQI